MKIRNTEIEAEITKIKNKQKESDTVIEKTLVLNPERMEAWKRQEELFSQIGKDEENMDSLSCFKKLIKTYTLESCYTEINNKIKNAEYTEIGAYLSSVMEGNVNYGHSYSYKKMHKPVYRGINHQFINHDDYQPNSIGCWP